MKSTDFYKRVEILRRSLFRDRPGEGRVTASTDQLIHDRVPSTGVRARKGPPVRRQADFPPATNVDQRSLKQRLMRSAISGLYFLAYSTALAYLDAVGFCPGPHDLKVVLAHSSWTGGGSSAPHSPRSGYKRGESVVQFQGVRLGQVDLVSVAPVSKRDRLAVAGDFLAIKIVDHDDPCALGHYNPLGLSS
jgi:hypothetical protein